MTNRLVRIVLISALYCMGWASQPHPRPVYIDNINIRTEAVGLFTKNLIEINFHNPNNMDSMEAVCYFSSNTSSFIKEMWLEIGGDDKRAETFERRTGERIYEKVTGRRLDPALLRTNGYGHYTLRVFPFKANETRRVLIELYSVLEEKSDSFFWYFSTNQTTEINIDYQSLHPSGTQFSKSIDRNPKVESLKKFERKIKFSLQYCNSVQLNFFYPEESKTYLIYNDRYRFSWQVRRQIDKTRAAIDYDLPLHVTLEKIVQFAKVRQPVYLELDYGRLLGFSLDFIEYLRLVHNLDVVYEEKSSASHWEERAGYWVYKNGHTFLDSNPEMVKNYSGEFYCTFLDYFIEYNELLKKDVRIHVDEEYLTPLTAKVVLEEDERVRSIRDEEVQKWENATIPIPIESDDIPDDLTGAEDEESFIPFYYLSERPEVVKRGKIDYPVLARKAGGEGRVTVKVLINKKGDVEKVEVIKGHPMLNDAAIEAAKEWKFKPGKVRDKSVKVWMGIPIDFKLMDSQKYPDYQDKESLADSSKWFDYYDKKFIFAMIEGEKVLIEEGFDLEMAVRISYKSNDHFELLFENPDLIKYSIYYPRILISTDKKKEEWVYVK